MATTEAMIELVSATRRRGRLEVKPSMKGITLFVYGAALGSLFTAVNPAIAQGTAFSYQGRLSDSGAPANGVYDLQFTIYDSTNSPGSVVAGPLTNSSVEVSNGLFTVTLDPGMGVFTGSARWLEIAVRTNGGALFDVLAPRQQLAPAPSSIYSANSGNAAFAATAGTATTANAVGGIGNTNVAQLNVPNTTVQATGSVVVTSGFITGASLISGGSGYTAPPAVTVSDATGSNAVITASVSNGVVTGLTIANAGINYSASAKLIIAPPPSNAYQTFNSGNIFNGVNTFDNAGNTFVGFFNGAFGSLFGAALTLTTTCISRQLPPVPE